MRPPLCRQAVSCSSLCLVHGALLGKQAHCRDTWKWLMSRRSSLSMMHEKSTNNHESPMLLSRAPICSASPLLEMLGLLLQQGRQAKKNSGTLGLQRVVTRCRLCRLRILVNYWFLRIDCRPTNASWPQHRGTLESSSVKISVMILETSVSVSGASYLVVR